jgi:hypothetical protein
MGETHNIGGFHSGFLSGKACKPYAMIASGAVLSERHDTGSVGPTQADTEFKSMGARSSNIKGSRSVKSQRRDIAIHEMLETGMKTFFNEN